MAKKTRARRTTKRPLDEKLSIAEIIFVVQFWHQRDRSWGRMVTENELVASDVGVRLRRKMLRTWGFFDQMLTPGQFNLEPGETGIGAARKGSR